MRVGCLGAMPSSRVCRAGQYRALLDADRAKLLARGTKNENLKAALGDTLGKKIKKDKKDKKHKKKHKKKKKKKKAKSDSSSDSSGDD